MPHLGLVLGSILAEVSRARRIADALTRDLIEQYHDDRHLSALSVPRAVLSDMTLNLRFQVAGVDAAPVLAVSPDRLGPLWSEKLRDAVIPQFIRRFALSAVEEAQVITAIATNLRAAEIRERLRDGPGSDIGAHAVLTGVDPVTTLRDWNLKFSADILLSAASGERASLVEASVRPVADSWNQIPQSVREKLGRKGEALKDLEQFTAEHLAETLEQEGARAELFAALRSRVDVLVGGEDVQDPTRVQTLTITLHGSDVETVMAESQSRES